jgi:branched-chain amino acid transport system ATP-binding protein
MRSISAAVMSDAILAIDDLHVSYGGSRILQGVTLQLGAAPLSLVGRNGMGKTTLCQAIVGLTPAASGRIRFKDAVISGCRPHEIARRGIGYVPQGRRVFPSLSVDEHLRLASSMGRRGHWTIETVYDRFPGLAERRGHGGAALSGGEQQMLAVARALMSRPRLLLMDEPSLGLAPLVIAEIFRIISQLHAEGVSIFLVEQNAHMAMKVAQHFYLMEQGRIGFSGTPDQLASDDVIQRAYLGSRKAA